MKRFALADCNNFFVSCERVFNPKLNDKPVVVLSSNDACVIARSPEAKKLGIKMGEPLFRIRDTIRQHSVIVHSSNFSLYGDMSDRIMHTLAEYATDIEIYSIDEAFLHLPAPITAYETTQEEAVYYSNYAHFVRSKIKQKIGIPISIGIGPTKTLAKIANHIAKKNPAYQGVFDVTDHDQLDDILKNFMVGDIWGVGYRYSKMLNRHGITHAYQLRECSDAWVRKNMTINGLKTVLELRGISCLELMDAPDPKQSITVSRMFGTHVTSYNTLLEGLSVHLSTAAQKLRQQKSIAGMISVFVCITHHHNPERTYMSTSMQLPLATSYTPTLIAAGARCLKKLFKTGVIYKKIGVIISDLYDENFLQLNSLVEKPNLEKQAQIMQAIDTLNAKLGRHKVFYASAGVKQHWHAKRTKKSPAYTTNWNELLTIQI